jgi:hypothetical protein
MNITDIQTFYPKQFYLESSFRGSLAGPRIVKPLPETPSAPPTPPKPDDVVAPKLEDTQREDLLKKIESIQLAAKSKKEAQQKEIQETSLKQRNLIVLSIILVILILLIVLYKRNAKSINTTACSRKENRAGTTGTRSK